MCVCARARVRVCDSEAKTEEFASASVIRSSRALRERCCWDKKHCRCIWELTVMLAVMKLNIRQHVVDYLSLYHFCFHSFTGSVINTELVCSRF